MEPIPTIVRWPSDEERKAAFEAYTLAVGKVAYAWNYLHEKLGELFHEVTLAKRPVALAIWYSSDSDRTKQGMLKAAIMASPPDRWPQRLPKAKDDLVWLMDRISNHLGDARNDAVHAPCVLLAKGADSEMAASYFSQHSRAKKLVGKGILVEFDWCERWTEELTRFTIQAREALFSEMHTWPNRPAKPDRKPKKDLKGSPPAKPSLIAT